MTATFLQTDAMNLDGVEITADGALIAFAKTARTGVQLYRGKEVGRDDLGMVRVYRPEAEVFSKETLDSFGNLPVTIGHPKGGVTSNNYRKENVGTSTADILRDGEYMRVGLKVIAEDAVKRIQSGERQLSGGYSHDLDWTPGETPEGEQYDARQINIRANHIAIVKAGRAGGAQIGDSDPWGTGPVNSEDKEKIMPLRNITVDGIPVETTDAGAAVIEKLQGALVAKDAEVADMKGKHDKMKSEKDDMEGKMKAAQKEAKDAAVTPVKLSQMAADRKVIEDRFKAFTGDAADPLATDADLHTKAITKYLGADEVKGMSADALASVFKHAKIGDAKVDPIRSVSMDGIKSTDGEIQAADAAVYAQAGLKMVKG